MEPVKSGDGEHNSSEDDEEEEDEDEDEDEEPSADSEGHDASQTNLVDAIIPEVTAAPSDDAQVSHQPRSPTSPFDRSQIPSPSASSIERRLSAIALSPTLEKVNFQLEGSHQATTADVDLDEDSEDEDKANAEDEVKERVAMQVSKERARQQRKYHSKKGAGKIGRPKGSKAKQDTRVKLNETDGW